ALEHARGGGGPVLIEAQTYRRSAHTTADDPTKYRTTDEEESWDLKDPLARLEKYLRAAELVDEDFFARLSADGDEMAARVRREAMDFPDPTLAQSFANVYAEAHPLVREELEFHRRYEAGFTDADPAATPGSGGPR
ncbi:MAG: thiamine pyrophosphate-dependent enzyme, partial [Micrococcaceae bacterium]|nr:thiamine pyrophosphate-dependent enzyme [Micrococcaceae bacterium]